jgi:hypothetical protein
MNEMHSALDKGKHQELASGMALICGRLNHSNVMEEEVFRCP